MQQKSELWTPLNHYVKMHCSYHDIFKECIEIMFYGDGPLPFHCRHYLALMAACRHKCHYLVSLHKEEFVRHMGPESWLDGLHNASQKIRDLDTANRLLAHRPWLLQLSHLKGLASAPNNWSICEMVQGALILSHTHALCSFVNGCGIKAACDPETTTIPKRVLSPSNHHHSENGDNLSRDLSVVSQGNDNVHRCAENSISRASGAIKNSPNGQRRSLTSVKTESSPTNKGVDSLPIINRVASISADSSFTSSSTSFIKRAGAVLTKCKSFSSCVENRNQKTDNGTTDDDNVEKLVACLQVLNEAGVAERSQEDKLKLFIDVNSQNFELFDIVKEVEDQRHLNSKDHPFSLFTEEPNFTYADFFKKADGVTTPTFTIHEYSWGDQGYSVVSELYCEISNVIDDKFRVIQDLTYHTMGGHKNVDTTKYRTAIWNYIQSLFGIRHDDYDYSEINKLLSRTMKSYIKILCCCPERMKDSLRNNVMIDFLMSEKHYTLDADGLCHNLISPIPRNNLASDQQSRRRISTIDITDADYCDHAVNNNDIDHLCNKDLQANFDEWTKRLRDAGYAIHRRDLRLGDCIGKGEFGDVLIGWLRERKVAVKVLKEAGQVVKSFLQEAVLMASLKHENLVQLMGVVLDDSTSLFIVVEYMPNGNLVDYLRSRGRQQVSLKQQLNFAYDTCAGMAYLESRNMVHRDLAARNVLLSEGMVAKVSDFGLAKKVDLEAHEEAQGKFPIKWTAPEALRHSQFTSKSDVWSYGVFLWEIYSFGRIPYPRIPVQDVVRHIEKGYRMDAPECCPSEIATIMFSCWDIDPTKRPSFKQLLYSLKTIDCVEI